MYLCTCISSGYLTYLLYWPVLMLNDALWCVWCVEWDSEEGEEEEEEDEEEEEEEEEEDEEEEEKEEEGSEGGEVEEKGVKQEPPRTVTPPAAKEHQKSLSPQPPSPSPSPPSPVVATAEKAVQEKETGAEPLTLSRDHSLTLLPAL